MLQPIRAQACPKACNYVYDPVCGYNGKNYQKFGNSCFMDAHNQCENHGPWYKIVDQKYCYYLDEIE